MGRPLKIKKSTTKDIGFNSFDALTNPVYPATLTPANFLGVVGGAKTSVATAPYPVVSCQVNVDAGTGVENGFIVRQKGSTTYLVTGLTSGVTAQCTLVNDNTPAINEMSIAIATGGDSTEIYLSKLTNKWALDYATPPNRYAVNFFTDEGTEIKSGAAQNATAPLAQVEKYTS
jgi:hypothetical protein